jgi:hypothetical protein
MYHYIREGMYIKTIKPCIFKVFPKTVSLKCFGTQLSKNRSSSRLLAQNRVSQVFLEPIKNRVSPRSALLKAVYLEALLYNYIFPLLLSLILNTLTENINVIKYNSFLF